jgi:hypothetical protein
MMNQQETIKVESSETVFRLHAWAIHDDPDCHCSQFPEDLHWIAVAAESEDHARVLAAAFYDGETPRDEWDWKTAFSISQVDTSTWPKRLQPQFPRHITDPESLRLMGWREEGESECESCGLHAMGMEAYLICDDCDFCKECCDCVKCEFCDYRMDMCVCDDE